MTSATPKSINEKRKLLNHARDIFVTKAATFSVTCPKFSSRTSSFRVPCTQSTFLTPHGDLMYRTTEHCIPTTIHVVPYLQTMTSLALTPILTANSFCKYECTPRVFLPGKGEYVASQITFLFAPSVSLLLINHYCT